MNTLQNNTKTVCCYASVFLSLAFGSYLWAQIDTNEPAAFSKLTKCLIEFRKTKSLKQFDEACLTMSHIDNIERQNFHQHRKEHIMLWLEVVSAIDQAIDPTFDGKGPHVALNLVPPPDGEGGPVYFAGVDPVELKNPKARAKYKAEIKANEELGKFADFQGDLWMRKHIAVMKLEDELEYTYTDSEADRKEWNDILSQSALSEACKKEVDALFPKKNH